jgi:hypothetical protein
MDDQQAANGEEAGVTMPIGPPPESEPSEGVTMPSRAEQVGGMGGQGAAPSAADEGGVQMPPAVEGGAGEEDGAGGVSMPG